MSQKIELKNHIIIVTYDESYEQVFFEFLSMVRRTFQLKHVVIYTSIESSRPCLEHCIVKSEEIFPKK